MTTSLFFLTEPDNERLNIRGSRDPLGLVPLWGNVGRQVVTNLTTASGSTRGFTTLLLGLHFADQAVDPGPDTAGQRLKAFLKFEQLAGYVRWGRNADSNLRGITQVKARLNENERALVIGADPKEQILSDQRAYGIWGLYTTPSVDSDLLVRQDMSLSGVAREFVERQYLPVLRREGLGDGSAIVRLLKRQRSTVNPAGAERGLFDALAKVLHPSYTEHEVAFYRTHLLHGAGGGVSGWQPRFAGLLESLPPDNPFAHHHLQALITKTRTGDTDRPLHDHLVVIQDFQYLMVAMANLFGYLQMCDKKRLPSVVRDVTTHWTSGFAHIRPAAIEAQASRLCAVYDEPDAGTRFVGIAQAFADDDFEEAIQGVLAHNRFVMQDRYGAEPWISVDAGAIDVRYRDATDIALRSAEHLKGAWENSFYLDPLKLITDELRNVR